MQLLLIFVLHLMMMTLWVRAAVPPSAAAQKDDIWDWVCNDANGNYTADSTFKSNLDVLLNNITTLNIPYGFYNLTTGQGPDQVYAIGLCRGDVVKVAECHACLGALKSNLTASCPAEMEAIGWSDKCMLRYSSSNILGVRKQSPFGTLGTKVSVRGNMDHFQQVTEGLLMTLPNKTAYGNSTLKFATGEAKVNSTLTVYALMQCTPDLKPYDCLGCIYWNIFYVMNEYNKLRAQSGSRVATPSCTIRYDTDKFYEGPPPMPGKVSVNPKAVIASVLAVTLAAALVLFGILISLFAKRRQHDNMRKKVFNFKALEMDYKIIKRATRHFSKKLGTEKSKVYEGKLEGNRIAVKRITDDEASSDVEEFKNMVMITTKLQHHNIAEVLGYSVQGRERLIVFEFVSKGNLEEILFDGVYAELRDELDWKKRYAIIRGIAQGLLYLHQHRYKILHLDLKAANVLLDDEWNPKIIDIGTTTLFHHSKKKQNQDLSDLPAAAETEVLVPQKTEVNPYMAPEMHDNDGIRSDKSDVYSFGVLVLEILAGRRRFVTRDEADRGKEAAEEDLIRLAERTSKQALNCLEVIDPRIAPARGQDSAESKIMKACVDIALTCVHEDREERPEMSTVVEKLPPSA